MYLLLFLHSFLKYFFIKKIQICINVSMYINCGEKINLCWHFEFSCSYSYYIIFSEYFPFKRIHCSVYVFIMYEPVSPLHTLCVYLRLLVCNLVRLRSVVLACISLSTRIRTYSLLYQSYSHVSCFPITLQLAHHLTNSPLFGICNNICNKCYDCNFDKFVFMVCNLTRVIVIYRKD